MLEFINEDMDGKSWEELCDKCLRMRYQKDGYQRVPATYGGDYGIEAFTSTGIVFQCYYPELNYSDSELHKHLQTKIRNDIAKLLANGDGFKKLGIQQITEWHLITPEYKDKAIIEYCAKKRKEILKEKNEKNLDYIDDNIKILVKVERDFRREICDIIFISRDYKWNLALRHTGNVDWSQCSAEKVQNIKRKIRAIMPDKGDPTWQARHNRLVDQYGSYYIQGMTLLRKLQATVPDMYEKIFYLEQICRRQVQMKCDLHEDNSINKQVFLEMLNEFDEKIASEFGEIITSASRAELRNELVSAWLADCPMDFR
ncbi:MAG TPA: hypothetical protein PKA28_17585 [Methylomusa anaerophila]|uniref:Uncharacterized protein n=1 Tax=Methylomusa anaerophila TaxID=1930071 RepID=A0A348AMI5_9FIRM|nr:hypothetical protein [Methylomusa anaerophila]BBB92283.1 hypothetical protein MAMMFC1_02968 [Methylomusa anaerophila]HML90256.1 hypothetical protein [Methylomusa anaerophila]